MLRNISPLTDVDHLQLQLEHREKGDYTLDDKNTKGIKIRMLNDFPTTAPPHSLHQRQQCRLVQWLGFTLERLHWAGLNTNEAHLTNGQALGKQHHLNYSQMSSNSRDPCSEGSHLYGREGRMETNPRPQCSHLFGGNLYTFGTGSCLFFHKTDPIILIKVY